MSRFLPTFSTHSLNGTALMTFSRSILACSTVTSTLLTPMSNIVLANGDGPDGSNVDPKSAGDLLTPVSKLSICFDTDWTVSVICFKTSWQSPNFSFQV
eukprot:CAMPEP_0169244530 /NCGR_PEP_ID=MMETSP1016-20121227/33692_1 /TAXON_ID=342587 /ORGANISM="Karlodinium micrum, Strain CCMP2283" /LENGTH=98 /DNA_ID=CAMNT_0009324933 /DNA_START=654 /DNA_END=950 /DNA_ORIENTATION=-